MHVSTLATSDYVVVQFTSKKPLSNYVRFIMGPGDGDGDFEIKGMRNRAQTNQLLISVQNLR